MENPEHVLAGTVQFNWQWQQHPGTFLIALKFPGKTLTAATDATTGGGLFHPTGRLFAISNTKPGWVLRRQIPHTKIMTLINSQQRRAEAIKKNGTIWLTHTHTQTLSDVIATLSMTLWKARESGSHPVTVAKNKSDQRERVQLKVPAKAAEADQFNSGSVTVVMSSSVIRYKGGSGCEKARTVNTDYLSLVPICVILLSRNPAKFDICLFLLRFFHQTCFHLFYLF